MSQRLVSLDAFRGFTIAAMLLVNNPGDWAHLYGPLAHAKWDGWTFTDTIFPFFVFISGVAMALSMGQRAAMGHDKRRLLVHTWKRGAVIIAIGLLLNLIPTFDLATVRIPGVLQRLGLCAMLAAPIVLYSSWRAQLGWCLALMAAYTAIQTMVSVPDALGVWRTASWLPGEDVGAWLDRTLMDGHLWRASKTWDPEGLLSTLPALSTQLAGVLVGHRLLAARAPLEKTRTLFLAGLVLLGLGQLLGAVSMPINKSLWTPAYVLFMAGWACVVFSGMYGVLDAAPQGPVRNRALVYARPLVVFGMNALFLFALSGLIAKMLGFIKTEQGLTLKAALYGPIQSLALEPQNASLLFAMAFTVFMYGIAWGMWRKGWFIKV